MNKVGKPKPIRLLTYGGFWAGYLSGLVNSQGDGALIARHICFPEINPYKIVREVFKADVVMRVGVRPGGAGKRILMLDLMWQVFNWLWPKKTYIYYWIGTDVLWAIRERNNSRAGFVEASKKSVHFANAPWLQSELKSIGILADTVLFPSGKISPPESVAIQWPMQFAVLSYIPDHRHQFYGGAELVSVALRLRDVRFLIVGGNGHWLKEKPENMEFLGQQNNMEAIYNSVHVVVRQVQHDAIGGTVREGLFFARHIIYSYPVPYTHHVAWGDREGLFNELLKLRNEFHKGGLKPNVMGREYALKQWDPKVLLNEFCVDVYRRCCVG
jgi:hypothetical protein